MAPGTPLPLRDEARWLRRPPHEAARAWRETVTVDGAAFQAELRPCGDGGCVVTFPALPQLMARGVTSQHARIKACALVERYLRDLRAGHGPAPAMRAHDRGPGLPRAA
jgi:predicted RNase H-like HicB family nuclease